MDASRKFQQPGSLLKLGGTTATDVYPRTPDKKTKLPTNPGMQVCYPLKLQPYCPILACPPRHGS